ncbi:hypothetical protein RZS08_06780, partial [Arthrospira platensis SPKY1]|nr:hypothetical protein [Arthrospira platensis SPKY1]
RRCRGSRVNLYTCRRCGAPLIVRHGAYGPFLACPHSTREDNHGTQSAPTRSTVEVLVIDKSTGEILHEYTAAAQIRSTESLRALEKAAEQRGVSRIQGSPRLSLSPLLSAERRFEELQAYGAVSREEEDEYYRHVPDLGEL